MPPRVGVRGALAVPSGMAPQADTAVPHPSQPLDRMADRLEHAAHLAVSAFADGDLDPGVVRAPHDLDVRRPRASSVERDASAEAEKRIRLGLALHPGEVRLLHPPPRMHAIA